MKTATLLKERLDGFQGHANLYKLDPPLKGHAYVIVSAVIALFSGPETLVFPATKKGEIVSFLDLAGYRGGLDHAQALSNEGYEVKK